jgi:glyoxylase-like metal-dependent hydrolase (beta-lactamase superfamily II)
MSTVDNKALKGAVPMASQPQEIAPDVYCLEVGKGIMRSNVYFVRSGSSWVLIDTASANCGRVIQEAAESLFGANTPPATILLTHDHPDHAGSTPELARRWGCLVYVHPDELALVTADFSTFFSTVKGYANPLDTWVILPLMRVMPRRHEAMLAESSFKDVARAFDPGAGVPGLPDWECIHTPGHSPGHVSFFRPSDRVLITGDAVLTVHLNSLWSFLLWGFGRNKQRLSGPPWYTTWSWRAAKESVASLARLEPRLLACGHGLPMSGSRTAPQLRAFAQSFCGSMLEDPQRSK